MNYFNGRALLMTVVAEYQTTLSEGEYLSNYITTDPNPYISEWAFSWIIYLKFLKLFLFFSLIPICQIKKYSSQNDHYSINYDLPNF